ncbi:EAL domain-containing protein [Phormidesmis sp. 146-33]
MKLSTEKKVTAGFGAALSLLGLVSVVSVGSVSQLNQSLTQVAQTSKVVESLQRLMSSLKDAETGQRGYLITGRSDYLAPYYRGVKAAQQELNALHQASANLEQQQRLATLKPIVETHLAELSSTIQLRRSQRLSTVLQKVQPDKSKAEMDLIRSLLQEMEGRERQVLEQQEVQANIRTQTVTWIISGSSLLAFTIVVASALTIHRDLKRRRQVETALQESELRFQTFMNHSPLLAFIKDEMGRYVYTNQSVEQRFDLPPNSIQGKTDFDWLPHETAQQVRQNDRIVLTTGQTTEAIETVKNPDGTSNYWLSFKFPLRSAGRSWLGGVSLEITERIRLEHSLFHQKELAQVTLQSIADAVITTDASGRVKSLNPVAEALTGWTQPEAAGLPLETVFPIIHETTREAAEGCIHQVLKNCTVGVDNQRILIARDGREIAIANSAAPIRARNGAIFGAVIVFHDVSQTRRLTQQLCWQASHDALTGLVNRQEFEDRLKQMVQNAESQGQQHALCYLDLDQFKIVNDTCGHAAGDELLQQVANLLQAQVRQTDTLARLGSDEFGLLLHRCPLPQARKIAETLCEQVQSLRFLWQEKVFTIGVSIGLVMITAETKNVAEALSTADAACYAAKNRGRNRVQVYQADDRELARQKGEIRWVARLTQALEENRFCLYYQSIVPVVPSSFVSEHYEVLLRLRDEEGNIVAPGMFIPAAERYHLMHFIDRWVIKTLFSTQGPRYRNLWQQCQHQHHACNHLYAINLSGASINDDHFIDFLHEQFSIHEIPPEMICFEITETLAIANLTKAAQFICDLRSLGCRFALDDFGSGMSSFAYLKNLPIDYLKIDGCFIRQMMDDPIDLAIVRAIKQIGQVMGIQTIAEFVENDEILEQLRSLGVNYAQGYGIAMPRPLPNPERRNSHCHYNPLIVG